MIGPVEGGHVGLTFAGLVSMAVVLGRRLHRSRRLHRRRANTMFMAGYRAAFRRVRRVRGATAGPPDHLDHRTEAVNFRRGALASERHNES